MKLTYHKSKNEQMSLFLITLSLDGRGIKGEGESKNEYLKNEAGLP